MNHHIINNPYLWFDTSLSVLLLENVIDKVRSKSTPKSPGEGDLWLWDERTVVSALSAKVEYSEKLLE